MKRHKAATVFIWDIWKKKLKKKSKKSSKVEIFTKAKTTSKPWSPEKILYLGGENIPIFQYYLAT